MLEVRFRVAFAEFLDFAEYVEYAFHREQPDAVIRQNISPEGIVLVSAENDYLLEALAFHGGVQE